MIGAAVATAGGAAAIPIPFSDATLLVPIQLGMMAKIAHLYKIKFDRAALMAIVSTTAATQVGRATFTGLIKLVPGAGTVIGGAIGAGVATTFTYAMGQAWLRVCQQVHAGKLVRPGRRAGQRPAPGRVPVGVQEAPRTQGHRRRAQGDHRLTVLRPRTTASSRGGHLLGEPLAGAADAP